MTNRMCAVKPISPKPVRSAKGTVEQSIWMVNFRSDGGKRS
uniref:Uncharacterized protein n=1 Tax=Arundo donax TaxID=35708 RepID=A0A0A9G7W3_ARUDO